ncbi:MAG TPA: helix-turn-helix domain-containing protein [Roseomonas sp.]|jgi:transcriptional regulator GlxA family with amidase domain
MHKVGFIVPAGFQLMSLAALSAFEVANLAPPGPHYAVRLLSEHGGPVLSSGGMAVVTEAFGTPDFDTVIMGSLTASELPPSDPALITYLRAAAKTARRTASICSGAFVLAEAGLLDGRRATMHWAHAAAFRARFPQVRAEEDRIFINDGPIWTSAGMTAGIDLVLALIENDLGAEAATLVARRLVMNQRRMGGQKQHSALLEMTPKSDRVALVLAHIRQNLRSALTIEELAAVASLSPRQFSRVFLAETGQSPAKAVEQLRLEAARFMVEDGRLSVNVVARETGFADRERMRRAFIRTYGVPAQALRMHARQG